MFDVVVKKCAEALHNGNKIMFCGNGGSAELSNHIAAEFVGRYKNERIPLNAVSLCANMAIITAIANDYGFEKVFSRQVEANGKTGDILFCISTSGKSKNVLLACEAAQKRGITTVALTGNFKCALNESTNYSLIVNEIETPKIQETQLVLMHKLVGMVEEITCLDN